MDMFNNSHQGRNIVHRDLKLVLQGEGIGSSSFRVGGTFRDDHLCGYPTTVRTVDLL